MSRKTGVAKQEKGSRQERRYAAILEHLHNTGSANVDELCKKLNVSVHTLRRDLEALHDRGLLRRVHGGAAQLEPFFYEPFRSDHSFQEQVESYPDEKRRVAGAAALLANEGDVIGMTAVTTTTETVRYLPMNRSLTVVTNTVNVAMELSKRKDIEVFVTGGALRGTWFSPGGSDRNPKHEQSILGHALYWCKRHPRDAMIDLLQHGRGGAEQSYGAAGASENCGHGQQQVRCRCELADCSDVSHRCDRHRCRSLGGGDTTLPRSRSNSALSVISVEPIRLMLNRRAQP